jgi:lipopolysaccharide transport system ATP-binding protein
MTDVVIRAERLGKTYLIGRRLQREHYTALRDVLASGARGFVGAAANILRGRALIAGDEVEEFWALKDVSCEVKRGEVVGIIGRNGAGKSTLLKILSRITEPTAGRVTIKGRVGSLLEVGTGFHPELTGRENIYLNGAILGMKRAEISAKFDEIVTFAEVERFLDTPVKRYSSGMYVRLAFAVAAHLEPEILIIDEVLAVGDAEFQKKCLGKMGEVAGGGRTVLFVSHDMGAVQRLCSSALLFSDGRIRYVGSPANAIASYLFAEKAAANSFDLSTKSRQGTGTVRLERVSLLDRPAPLSARVFEVISISFVLRAECPDSMRAASVWVLFRNSKGDDVLMLMQRDAQTALPARRCVAVEASLLNILTPGQYSVACGVHGDSKEILDWINDAFTIEVEGSFDGGGSFDGRLGLVTGQAQWRTLTTTSPTLEV